MDPPATGCFCALCRNTGLACILHTVWKSLVTRLLSLCRVHFPRLECRTDATHVLRCTLGTAVRILNWTLAASAGFSALCLAAGISRSALVCRMLEVHQHNLRGPPCPGCHVTGPFLLMWSFPMAPVWSSLLNLPGRVRLHMHGWHGRESLTPACRHGPASACWRWRCPRWQPPHTGLCRARPPWWQRSWGPRCATSCSSTPCGTWRRWAAV